MTDEKESFRDSFFIIYIANKRNTDETVNRIYKRMFIR